MPRQAAESLRGLQSGAVFELTVERDFSAAHAVRIGDHVEPIHGHNWRVRATVRGDRLDANELLIDFHQLERWLEEIVQPFHNRSLNEVAPFDAVNPTAERVVKHIAEALARRLPESVTLSSVSVSEAPGCTSTYRPDRTAS